MGASTKRRKAERFNRLRLLAEPQRVYIKTNIKAIDSNLQESRREWMLWMFERAGKKLVT